MTQDQPPGGLGGFSLAELESALAQAMPPEKKMTIESLQEAHASAAQAAGVAKAKTK